jgi:hypothetical protein
MAKQLENIIVYYIREEPLHCIALQAALLLLLLLLLRAGPFSFASRSNRR